MTEKDYLLLLKKQIQPKRVVCGFNEDAYGRAVVTTGVPKEYKEGHITYEDQKNSELRKLHEWSISTKCKKKKIILWGV